MSFYNKNTYFYFSSNLYLISGYDSRWVCLFAHVSWWYLNRVPWWLGLSYPRQMSLVIMSPLLVFCYTRLSLFICLFVLCGHIARPTATFILLYLKLDILALYNSVIYRQIHLKVLFFNDMFCILVNDRKIYCIELYIYKNC